MFIDLIHRIYCGEYLDFAVNKVFNYRMNSGYKLYIWQEESWPDWKYDLTALAELLQQVSRSQGLLLGRLADIGLSLRNQASLITLTDDVVKTSEIEGELLNVDSVRSSVARHLGVDIGAIAPVDRHIDGVVEMVLDVAMHSDEPLTSERLFGWHQALFPLGYSGMNRISVGQWRLDEGGAMQVVSGSIGRRKIHFEAPPANSLPEEMIRFLDWANEETGESLLIKAGLAHLWFVTLHPFDDGNGRIARAVGDLFLARADGGAQRFYSLSAQIQKERKDYYDVLERTQKGTLDVTNWLLWFLGALERALGNAHKTLDRILMKTRFWQRWAETSLNKRQVKLINRLLDGFEGKLTSSKWAVIAKCSSDTALRDITQLLELGILKRTSGGGRSTGYELSIE